MSVLYSASYILFGTKFNLKNNTFPVTRTDRKMDFGSISNSIRQTGNGKLVKEVLMLLERVSILQARNPNKEPPNLSQKMILAKRRLRRSLIECGGKDTMRCMPKERRTLSTTWNCAKSRICMFKVTLLSQQFYNFQGKGHRLLGRGC